MPRWLARPPTPARPAGHGGSRGVAAIRWDEASRFGLASFKALGGAYAVRRLLEGRLFAEREGDRHRTRPSTARFARGVTVTTCATDGNHGRSVA
ncbi:MAG: hypothetical protein R3D25_14860 [Geminicoccaceae bacterium]